MGTPQCELEMEVTYMDLHEKAESQESVSSLKNALLATTVLKQNCIINTWRSQYLKLDLQIW